VQGGTSSPQVVVVQGGEIIVHQTERVDHFHGGGGRLCVFKCSADALVCETDKCRAEPFARGQHRVLDGRGQFRLAASSFQCPRQEGITRITMGLEYGRHNAIVGCRP
jgi:hypothetical protein